MDYPPFEDYPKATPANSRGSYYSSGGANAPTRLLAMTTWRNRCDKTPRRANQQKPVQPFAEKYSA
jgi:hypothetical protein